MDKKEEMILKALIEDKARKCGNNYSITYSHFLDPFQRAVSESVCKTQREAEYRFYGGFSDAERCICVFLPDYIDAGEDIASYFIENEGDNPLTVVRVSLRPGSKVLTHRDYLGSLTGLGIKREMIGDILVSEAGADIVILKEIEDFLMVHYEKAGRNNVSLSTVSTGEIHLPTQEIEEKRDTVASLRLDNLVASAFGLSRGKADEAIRGGLVFVNNGQAMKSDMQVKEGDKLVLRGKGKVVLSQVGNRTRKDRISIMIKKYV